MIRIELRGDLAFESRIKLGEGFCCDVYCDALGIPYLPLGEVMGGRELPPVAERMAVGLARPDGYFGIVREAVRLARLIPDAARRIRSLYTDERLDAATGLRMRSVRAGQVFVVPFDVSLADLAEAACAIESITQIGIVADGITGEVSCTVVEEPDLRPQGPEESELLDFGSLDYSLLVCSPTALFAPFENGDKTLGYVGGAEVRRALSALAASGVDTPDLTDMRFSNAYVTLDGIRQVPVPMCLSVVKLAREQLRYRLSPGKDPSRVEQDVALAGAYGSGFCEHHVTHTRPLVERIVSADGELFDALEAGQVLKGTIFGTNEQLRSVARLIRRRPYLTFGALVDEGYGLCHLSVDGLREDAIPHEVMMSRFDVACLSHVIVLGDDGMPATQPQDLLGEVERVCGLAGALEVEGAYTGVYVDHSDRFGWGSQGPVTRCLQMGSILRLRTRDGRLVDVSNIMHAFVGEGTADGYGEIMCLPAIDEYYRVTTLVAPDTYTRLPEASVREANVGVAMLRRVLRELARDGVSALADIDATDVVEGGEPDRVSAQEMLRLFHESQDPTSDLEELSSWYEEALARARQEYGVLREAMGDAQGS